jgi:hypothetical protein
MNFSSQEFRSRGPGGGKPQEPQKHFMQCYDCGRWIDMRDVDGVIAHEQACGGALAQPTD